MEAERWTQKRNYWYKQRNSYTTWEMAWKRLESLVRRGVPYESWEMLEALGAYQSLKTQWEQKEQEYLRLRVEIKTGMDPLGGCANPKGVVQ